MRKSGTILLFCAIAAMTGCSDRSAGGSLDPDVNPVSAAVDPSELLGSDLDLYNVAQQVPGYAGIYRDKEHVPHIRLVDPSQSEAARAAVAQFLQANGDAFASVAGLIEPATYSGLDLLRWRVKARQLFGDPGVTGVGLDIIGNTVKIGLVDETARDRVQSRAVALGIPAAAISLPVMGRPYPSAQLYDQVRPMTGGVQLTFSKPDSSGAIVPFLCTRGPTVHRGLTRGFITNSHCSSKFAGITTANTYKQGSSTIIGQESVDPPAVPAGGSGTCAYGNPCRKSDAIFVADYGSPSVGFDIAITTVVGIGSGNPGNTTISYRDPVVGFASANIGDYLYKTGASSGTTYGMVTDNCFDFKSVPEDWVLHYSLLCQGIIAAGVEEGDSGSPIFFEAANNDATVYGVLWGQSCHVPNQVCNFLYFSSWLSVAKEIGTLTLY